MVIKSEELQVESRTRLRGGYGTLEMLKVVPDEFMPEKCRVFSVMSVEKGCSAGNHEHSGETEIYYVLEGEGIIDDNGTKRPFKKGDVNICGGGDYHGVANENDETLKIFAVVIKD